MDQQQSVPRHRLVSGLLLPLLAALAPALLTAEDAPDPKKEREKEVQSVLDDFKKSFKGGDVEKSAAVRKLAGLQARRAVELLAKSVLDTGPMTRIESAKVLGEYVKDKVAGQALVRALPVPPKNAEVSAALFDALGKVRDWGTTPAVSDLFNDSDTEICVAAMRAAGKTKNPAAVKKLIDVLQERNLRNPEREAALNQAAKQALQAITGRAEAAGGKKKGAGAGPQTNWYQWWRDNEADVTARLVAEEKAEQEKLAAAAKEK